MNVREFLTKFVIKTEGHEHLDHVEHQLEQIKERLELFAAAEVVEKIYELGERFAKFAEELHVASVNAGITVEALQKLSIAAAQSGVTQDEMSMSMARLSRRLYEARQGSAEAQKAFMQAGFSQEQVLGFKTGQDALLGLADRFKGIQDPIQKAALAQELLGRGGAHMVGFLSKGSAEIRGLGVEAEKLGTILTEHQVEALVETEHAFLKLGAVVRSFGATVAAYFAPSIQDAIKEFLKFYEVNRKVIDLNVRKFVWDLTYALGYLWGIVKVVAQSFFDFAKSHSELVRKVGEVVVALITLTAVIWLGQKAWTVMVGGFNILATVFTGVIGQLALITVGFHDLYALFKGEKTWTQSFIEWLGIANQVETVMFSIFDILSDLLNLDFSKLGGDLLKDVKGIGDFLGVNKLFGSPAAALDNLGNAQHVSADVGGSALNALGGGSPVAPAAGNYEINAPITVNVPVGTDPKMVGEKVKQGVQEHLDRVHRESARSLRGAVAY